MCRSVCILGFLFLVLVAGPANAGTLPSVLTWTNPDTTDAIEIDKAPSCAGTFNKLTTVPAGTTTYTDATNAPGDTPCYRVEYFNASGNGPSSNTAGKSFPSLPTVAPVLGPIQ